VRDKPDKEYHMVDVISQISGIVDKGGLLIGDDVAARPADWLGKANCMAKAIVRPSSAEQLSAVMKVCHAAGQTIVPAGGLTGLVHGTEVTGNDVMISFERMTEIEAIDPIGRTVTVQCGATMQKVQERVEAEGLLFAVDLGARGLATIGGNISTNAGGNQVVRYGMMREQVLGLEAVLADGTIISSMNSLLKNNSGYDLKQLFIGTEGTLGLVTRAVLRLHPLPISANTALVAVPDFSALIRLFSMVGKELGGMLTAFEVMWADHYQMIAVDSGRHNPPLPSGSPYYAIIESNGTHPEKDEEQFGKVLGDALESEIISDAVIAASKSQQQSIWDIREDIEGLAEAIFPAAIFDISLPIITMVAYISGIRSSLEKQWGDQVRLIVFGHLGDGNLHIGVSPRPWNEENREIAEKIVYEPLAEIGGAVSAEHGIGLEKRAWLYLSRNENELTLMRTLKRALDPKNILNPGKVLSDDGQ